MSDKSLGFKDWQDDRNYLFCCVEGKSGTENRAAYNFAINADGAQPGIASYPMVCLLWQVGNQRFLTNFVGRLPAYRTAGAGRSKEQDRTQLIDFFMTTADDYFNFVSGKMSAKIVVGNTASDRLEAEIGETHEVMVPIRVSVAKEEIAEYYLQIATNGVLVGTITNTIPAGLLEPVDLAMVTIPSTCTINDVISLKLFNEGGDLVDENSITCVEVENTPKNPRWLGQRGLDDLEAGEWTMDYDLVLAKAKEAESFSLTLIGGSTWCPDCVKTDAYLVDTPAFEEWTLSNGVFCAAIDVPSFPSNGKTCLLTYEPKTVSARYVNATVPPQDSIQSGAGYLSRNAIPQTGNGGTNATAILARNLNLATNSVESGGLCRPEWMDPKNPETGSWKVGIPGFLMQAADGRILGRFYQFSNVSPGDTSSVAAYIQRLDELRALANDLTEESNRHWSTATNAACALSLANGSVASTVSAIDTSDFWRLADRTKWVRATFAVKGMGEAAGQENARLALWKVAAGTATKVAAASGDLAAGFVLTNQVVEAAASAEYFIQLETIASSAAFSLEHSGDSRVAYELTVSAAEDPGTLQFEGTSCQVTEAEVANAGGALRVFVPVSRTGGATGATNAVATVDEASTAMTDRYVIVTNVVSWAEGETGVRTVEIQVFDDANADGTQALVLRLGGLTYTVTIVDNDVIRVGKLTLGGVSPAFAKTGLVIAQEASTVAIGVSRLGGASGDVACTLKTTAGSFETMNGVSWTSREAGVRTLDLQLPALTNCPSGKLTVTFDTLTGGITADSAAKSLQIQLIGTEAPRFETDSKDYDCARYCQFSQEVAVVQVAEGAVLKLAKLSGTIPGGLTAKLVDGRMVVAGAPMVRAGIYEAVYQVSQIVNRKTVPGLTVRLAFSVRDVATLDPTDPGANPSIAQRRTFPDVMIVDEDSGRLMGLVTGLSVSPTGACSAKYKCAEGTLSLSSKSWSGYDASIGMLQARLTIARCEYAMELEVYRDGEVAFVLTDPEMPEASLVGLMADAWSAVDPAADWTGAYTAAVLDPVFDDETKPIAAGCPVLTFKMESTSAVRRGQFSYSGVLPNGQTFGGTGTLVRDGADVALLPIYYRSQKDFFTAVVRIDAAADPTQTVTGDGLPFWRHTETVPEASYSVQYTRIVGSVYDRSGNLLDTVDLNAKGHDLTAADVIDGVPVVIGSAKPAVDAVAENPNRVRLSFSKDTGLLTGSFKVVNAQNKSVTANYRGVVLSDWGDGCPSCGDVPWAYGAFWYPETLSVEAMGRTQSVSVKVGDVLTVESY